MNNQSHQSIINTEEDKNNVLDEIYKYLNYWPWFIMALAIAFAISFFYLKFNNKIYATTTKIQMLDESKGIELNTSAYLFNRSNINLENEVELLKSYPIIESVVVKNNLNITFFNKGNVQTFELLKLPFNFIPLIKSDSIYGKKVFDVTITPEGLEILEERQANLTQIKGYSTENSNTIFPFKIIEKAEQMHRFIGLTFQIKFVPKEDVVDQIKSAISIKEIGDFSNILALSLQGENKTKSELILNALVEEYKQDGIKDRQLVSKRTIEFINERLIDLFGELDSIENDKKDFKQQNKLIDIQGNASQSILELNTSDTSLFDIYNQLYLAKALKDKLIDNSKELNLWPANFGFNNAELNEFIDSYNTKVLELKKLNMSAGISNPLVINIKKHLDKIKINLNNSLDIFIKELQFKQEQLKNQNKKINTKIASLPLNEKLLRAIERQQQIKESLYVLLLQKKEEASINLSVAEPSVKIVEYAKSKRSAIYPKPFIIYSMAISLGILCPFGVLYLILGLDTKIRSTKEIEKTLPQIPVVAEIPLHEGDRTPNLIDSNENTVQSEVFRILSSNINLISSFNKDSGKVIYCTSSIKGEGKTYVSMNLSLILASFKKKVLLIGADLRNPQVHKQIGYQKNYKGLSNYLFDEDRSAYWEDHVINGFKNYKNLDVLMGGEIPPNAPQLLNNGRFEKLLIKARLKYDYIIVDTAPTLLVADTFIISKYADLVLYLVKVNYSDKRILEYLKKLYETEKLSNIALVVNGIKNDKSNNFNYGYGYSYN